jgi:HAD superfamily hydrolase (TIGR01509 family)
VIIMEKQDILKKDDPREMLQDIEAVIFDLDGSLVDSMWLWKAIDVEYLGRFGILLPEDLQSKIEGMSFMETAIYFKEHFPIPDSLEEIMNAWNKMAWDKYLHQVPLKKGVSEFLDGCRKRGILLGIATSNSRELVENVLGAHGLREYFGSIMTGSEVKKGKPSPDIYLAAARQLGAAPERCLVFEDILPGILAGKNAGMRVCAVEDEYSAAAREEKKRAADYYINDYVDLL